MLIHSTRKKHSRIPLISLIDMTFMLFIFFILMTRFTNLDQVELNVSDVKAAGAAKTASAPPSVVYLRLSANAVQFGGGAFTYKEIGTVLKPYFPAYAAVIEAGEGASVQQMVSVLDAVKLAGATEITLKEAP